MASTDTAPTSPTTAPTTVRPDKAAAVAELVDSFAGSSAALLTEYRGLSVKQLQELRRSLGDNAQYAVVKNTLTAIAAKRAGVDGFDDLLTGPTAIAFVTGDVVEAAKGLRDFARANPQLVVKGGYFEGRNLDAAEIATLADLESREVLLAKLAGGMLASLSQAAALFNAPLAQTARLAAALRDKAEDDPSILAGGTAPAAPEASTDAPATDPDPTPGEQQEIIGAPTPDEAPAEVSVDEPTAAPAEAHPTQPSADES